MKELGKRAPHLTAADRSRRKGGERERWQSFLAAAARLSDADLLRVDALFDDRPEPVADPDEWVASLAHPKPVAQALLALEDDLATWPQPLLVNVAARLLLAPGVGEWLLASDTDEEAEDNFAARYLARHPKLDAAAIRCVWQALLSLFGEWLDAEDVFELAGHAECPEDVHQALLAMGNLSVAKRVARYGHLGTGVLSQLLNGKWAIRQALAQSRRAADAVISVLCADEDPRVAEAALREWRRRGGKSKPSAAQLAAARAELERNKPAPEQSDEQTLLDRYRHDPGAWSALIQHPAAASRLLAAGLLDGRDPRPSPYYRRRFARDIGFVAKLLPRGRALYELAASSTHALVLNACLVRLQTSETMDPSLLEALASNGILRHIGVRPLTAAFGTHIWNWDYDPAHRAYPTRAAALEARLSESAGGSSDA